MITDVDSPRARSIVRELFPATKGDGVYPTRCIGVFGRLPFIGLCRGLIKVSALSSPGTCATECFFRARNLTLR